VSARKARDGLNLLTGLVSRRTNFATHVPKAFSVIIMRQKKIRSRVLSLRPSLFRSLSVLRATRDSTRHASSAFLAIGLARGRTESLSADSSADASFTRPPPRRRFSRRRAARSSRTPAQHLVSPGAGSADPARAGQARSASARFVAGSRAHACFAASQQNRNSAWSAPTDHASGFPCSSTFCATPSAQNPPKRGATSEKWLRLNASAFSRDAKRYRTLPCTTLYVVTSCSGTPSTGEEAPGTW
jgi:hypothetical protein